MFASAAPCWPSPVGDCVAIVISSKRREIFSSHVTENARSLAPLEMTSMGHSCIATQSLEGEEILTYTRRQRRCACSRVDAMDLNFVHVASPTIFQIPTTLSIFLPSLCAAQWKSRPSPENVLSNDRDASR